MTRRLLVEADGGSRGNPGPAAYGALVRDPDTGTVLATRAEHIGVASNNVAEYGGLVAGLRLAEAMDPTASIEVRMDSKLVVEQMSGRWKIKHEDMQRLAAQARTIVDPARVRYTWIPRERNKDADRLANEALDDAARGRPWRGSTLPVEAGAVGAEAPGAASEQWHPDTLAVRGGLTRTAFDETAEALFLTSGFVYASAADAEAAFAGDVDRYLYSRYGHPTVAGFEERLRLVEGAPACFATATGMAAVWVALAALVSAGDRIVAARSLFGSCLVILDQILPRFGVVTEFVDGHDLRQWEAALSTPAAAVFFASPSNPMQELVDVAAVCDLAHTAGAKVVVDNVFATPLLQRPFALGADVVVYSATKHIDGQGRTMGGAVLGPKDFVDGPVQTLMRHTGPSLSPFSAWILTKDLETMVLRVERQTATALRIAHWLQQHPRVRSVRYPYLDSHPQHALARRQMSGGGTVVTFEVRGGKSGAFAMLDALRCIDILDNLGDAKSLVTHPATTTHRRLGESGRLAVGITDEVVRLSVGLEHPDDLLADLEQALASH